MIKRKSYLDKIRPFIDTDLVKVLTGIRRSGKSVLLEQIGQELEQQGVLPQQIIRFNFEDLSNTQFCTAQSLRQEIARLAHPITGKIYLFFDEIQEVEEWEKCINSLRVEYDCDIYITGSNAALLSGELATYLAGRYVEFVIYPFSYQEFFELYQSTVPKIGEGDIFTQYLKFGGMPFLAQLGYAEIASFQYLRDMYDSVVLKDIVKRHQLRDVDLLERIMRFFLANLGQPFSANSISKYFLAENRKVSTETILNYLKYCKQAFLIYPAARQDLVGKKVLTVNEKYYLADHGLREAIYGNNMRDINQVLENIVYIELLRRGYKVTVGKIATREIDFLAEKEGKRIYIQVSYLLASDETVAREFGAFNAVTDHWPKYVMSLDEFNFSRDGIQHLQLKEFLISNTF